MTGYLAKLKEETCGARPRETLVKRAFVHFGGMRRHPRRPSSPHLPPPPETIRGRLGGASVSSSPPLNAAMLLYAMRMVGKRSQ